MSVLFRKSNVNARKSRVESGYLETEGWLMCEWGEVQLLIFILSLWYHLNHF